MAQIIDIVELPELQLSQIYDNGYLYGVAYEDGHGNIEMLDDVDCTPERLAQSMVHHAKDFTGGKLYIVALEPVKIVKVVVAGSNEL
jgi:hypothetical protein